MQKKWLPSAVFILIAALIADFGCGGNGSTISPPLRTAVTITYTSKALDANQSDSLTATVSNDPNNRGVKWIVTCPFDNQGGRGGPGDCGGMAKAASASGAADMYNAPSRIGAAVTVTVEATSVSDPTKSASVRLTVNQLPTLVSPPPVQPSPGNVGQPFSVDLTQYVQGGSSPFNWSVKSGMLPAGLTLDGSTGVVSGTPTATSASALQRHSQINSVRAAIAGGIVFTEADSGNPPMSVNVQVSLVINPPLPLGITTATLPTGTVGVDYKRGVPCFGPVPVLINAAGGVQPYTFAAVPGSSLPPGLNLSSLSSGSGSGLISGIPTTAGTYNFLVTATDAESPPMQASANYTITVVPRVSPTTNRCP